MDQESANKCEHFRKLLMEAVGMYCDYRQYQNELTNLDEEYDESLETYHFETWMGKDVRTILNRASQLLDMTEQAFSELCSLAEDEFYDTFLEICLMGAEMQMQVFGVEIPEQMQAREAFETLTDKMEYRYNQQEALDMFLHVLIVETVNFLEKN